MLQYMILVGVMTVVAVSVVGTVDVINRKNKKKTKYIITNLLSFNCTNVFLIYYSSINPFNKYLWYIIANHIYY